MPPPATAKRLRNHDLDLRDMLLAAGVGQYTVLMSIPYMMMLPLTTEPYAQGVQQIIQGLQRLLNKRGARLTVDGGLGGGTVRALMIYAGPRWTDKSWAQLYGDVITGEKWQGWERNGRGKTNAWNYAEPGLGADPVSDLIMNPFVLAAGAFLVWWKFFRKPSRGGNGGAKLLPAGELEDL